MPQTSLIQNVYDWVRYGDLLKHLLENLISIAFLSLAAPLVDFLQREQRKKDAAKDLKLFSDLLALAEETPQRVNPALLAHAIDDLEASLRRQLGQSPDARVARAASDGAPAGGGAAGPAGPPAPPWAAAPARAPSESRAPAQDREVYAGGSSAADAMPVAPRVLPTRRATAVDYTLALALPGLWSFILVVATFHEGHPDAAFLFMATSAASCAVAAVVGRLVAQRVRNPVLRAISHLPASMLVTVVSIGIEFAIRPPGS